MSKPDAIDELGQLLEEAGAQLTFDPLRDCTQPCVGCAEPGPHPLVDIGERTDERMAQYMGKKITRPLCERCQKTVRWGVATEKKGKSDV